MDADVEEPVIDHTADFIDRRAGLVRSNTGELVWDISGAGFFSVDTAGTQAVIGNVGGQVHELGHVAIAPKSPYAQIYVTALDPDGRCLGQGGRDPRK